MLQILLSPICISIILDVALIVTGSIKFGNVQYNNHCFTFLYTPTLGLRVTQHFITNPHFDGSRSTYRIYSTTTSNKVHTPGKYCWLKLYFVWLSCNHQMWSTIMWETKWSHNGKNTYQLHCWTENYSRFICFSWKTPFFTQAIFHVKYDGVHSDHWFFNLNWYWFKYKCVNSTQLNWNFFYIPTYILIQTFKGFEYVLQ